MPNQVSDVASRNPVNFTAAIVTSSPSYLYRYDGASDSAKEHARHSDVPMPTKPYVVNRKNQISVDLTGRKFGRFTVFGYSIDASGDKPRWVCQCACGRYEIRTAKVIKAARDADDCCVECREVRHLKRKDEFRRHGRNFDDK